MPVCENVPGAGISGGDTPTIIRSSYISGYVYCTSNCDHYHPGVDIQSQVGNENIYSPFKGKIVAHNSCESCFEVSLPENCSYTQEEGNTYCLGDHKFDAAYNYGFGVTTIVEYAYEDLAEEEIQSLRDDGYNIDEGQSIYILFAHLDPGSNLGIGTTLDAGDSIAVLGNSGASDGAHAHVEAAIAESGLQPGEKTIWDYWLKISNLHKYSEGEGNRIDPTSLFDVPVLP